MSPQRMICVLLLSFSIAAHLHAAQRTFVSALNGNDANDCSRNAPCRQFSRAMLQTDNGGEIIVLDSGGYGTVTISTSVSIISPSGVYAGITSFSGSAVTIDPVATFKTVLLRGLTMNGLGGAVGIDHSGSGISENTIHVENCIISGFSIRGMNLPRNGRYFIADTTSRKNGDWGIYISGGPGPSIASLRRVVLERNGHGGLVVDNATVAVRDSVASTNDVPGLNWIGFWARGEGAGDTARLSLDGCQSNHNVQGFVAGGSAGTAFMWVANSNAFGNAEAGIAAKANGNVRVSTTSSVGNGTGFLQEGTGVFESRGNNNVSGNTEEKTGTIGTYTE